MTGCNEQVTELAARVKVEEMGASLPGDDTGNAICSDGHVGVARGSSALPQDLTCKVCAPAGAFHRGIDVGVVDEGVGAAAIERETHSAHRLARACAVIGQEGEERRKPQRR